MARRYLFSGSSFGRTEQCPAWVALPHVDTMSRAAVEGIGLHEFVAPIAEGAERDASLARIDDPKIRAWAEKIDVAQVPRGLAERSLAYDPVTGMARFTGDTQRRYTLEPGEIPLTLDLIVLDGPETLPATIPSALLTRPGYARSLGVTDATIIDFKSTQFEHDPYYDEPQVALGGLAVTSAFGLAECGVAVGVIDPEGSIAWTQGRLSAAYLDNVAKRVRAAVAGAEAAVFERGTAELRGSRYEPDVRRGHHCRYCPAFFHCPGTQAVMKLATGEHFALVEAEPGPAYTRVQAIERFADAARDIIKEHVRRNGPAETGDGRLVTLDSRGSFKLRRA